MLTEGLAGPIHDFSSLYVTLGFGHKLFPSLTSTLYFLPGIQEQVASLIAYYLPKMIKGTTNIVQVLICG